MLKHIGAGLLWGIPSFIVGAVIGGFLISKLSSNTHDRSMEAAMTAVFFWGPLAGVIGFIVGFVRSMRG